MTDELTACVNKTCNIRKHCRRNTESGPQSDRQVMAAFAPFFGMKGWDCDGFVKKPDGLFGKGQQDETRIR